MEKVSNFRVFRVKTNFIVPLGNHVESSCPWANGSITDGEDLTGLLVMELKKPVT